MRSNYGTVECSPRRQGTSEARSCVTISTGLGVGNYDSVARLTLFVTRAVAHRGTRVGNLTRQRPRKMDGRISCSSLVLRNLPEKTSGRLGLETLFLDLLEQGGAIEPEELGRAILVPMRLFEGLENQIRLEVANYLVERDSIRGNTR
jgi:hypothetical protein